MFSGLELSSACYRHLWDLDPIILGCVFNTQWAWVKVTVFVRKKLPLKLSSYPIGKYQLMCVSILHYYWKIVL